VERARVNGIELDYEIKGYGEPVLLIHGSHVAGSFKPLLAQPALTDEYMLIRPSPPPPTPPSPAGEPIGGASRRLVPLRLLVGPAILKRGGLDFFLDTHVATVSLPSSSEIATSME
jgi:hypothetical protein